MQEPQPLGCNLPGEIVDAGGVAARPGKAGDKTKPDRVFGGDEDDGNCRRCRLSGEHGTSERGDHGDLSANQFGRQQRQPIYLALRPAVFDQHVLALDIAGVFEALAECAQAVRVRVVRRCGVEEPNHGHRRLLSMRSKRPRHRRTAEQRDELAALHSITSSARASNASGTVKPSALAVFILMISSKWVGCSTGRSAGRAPLRILSTYTAALRNRSGYLGEYAISPPSSANQRGTETPAHG